MTTWLIILLLLSLIVFIGIKIEHHFNIIKIVGIVFISLLLIGSIYVMSSSEDFDLTSIEGVIDASYLYIGWLGEMAKKTYRVSIDTTGKVIDTLNNTGK